MMTQSKETKLKRQRGVILTSQGLEKLHEAKTDAEYQENKGNRYTLEALSARTGYSVDTLMKVFACESGVDKQTLKCCFKSFNLSLEESDYYRPNFQIECIELSTVEVELEPLEPELPEGQVSLNSAFYIERTTIESDCYKAILQPGVLIRLKAPRRRGKTSLLTRILNRATKGGYHSVPLTFHMADSANYQDLDKFLRWFCAYVSLGVKLPNKVVDYWDDLFGSKISCKIYFEEYLLAKIDAPIVLGLDDIDLLFQYPDLADDFFGLLRAWHEEAKNRDIWKKLRLIVVHSTEVYIPLNVNQSPFNVGLPIELQELTPEEIQDLSQRYELNWTIKEVEQLMSLVGGQPYLVQLALYNIWHKNITLNKLCDFSLISANSIYSDHLQRQLYNLQQRNSGLLEAFAKVVMAKEPIDLDLIQAFQLQSLGLVNLKANQVISSCELYARYFRNYFSSGGLGIQN